MTLAEKMRRRTATIRLCLLLASVGGLIAHALVFNFLNDDAFISFRYADNLVRHGELVYNPGERVEGYTNFLWTMVMAAVMGLGLDVALWSRVLGIAAAAGSLWVVARFSARVEDQSSPWDALAPMMLAAAPAYACWSTGGLETQLFTLLITLGWSAYLTEEFNADDKVPLCGLWFALAAMTRPEGLLFLGLTAIHRFVYRLWTEGAWRPCRIDCLRLGIFLGVFSPYYAWRWWYYGWPFPNTYYVKTGASRAWQPGFNYVWGWVRDHVLWLLPLLAGIRRGLPASREARLLSLGCLYTGVFCVYIMSVGGDFMALYRFLVPLMPLLAVIGALGTRALWVVLQNWNQSRIRLSLGASILVIALSIHVSEVDRRSMKVGSEGGVDSIGWLKMFTEQCSHIGIWLETNAPADASLATTAAGIIQFYSKLYSVDILGLNDEWVAHNVQPRGNRPGHTRSAPLSYLLEKEVDYMIFHPSMSERRPRKGKAEIRSWKSRGYQWTTEQVPGLVPPWWGFWKRQTEAGQPGL